MKNPRILIIGAGGIGSLLADHVTRAVAFSELTEEIGNLELTLMDGDTVESRNLPHQQFGYSDQSMHKVIAIQQRLEAMGITIENGVIIRGIAEDFSAENDLSKYDLVVVAVDREDPRTLVHVNAQQWLDLRARGDGFVMCSHQTDSQIIELLPKLPAENSASCQLDDAIETGNIQFGFALAATYGAQWIIQWLRQSMLPPSRMSTIHAGELPFPTYSEGVIE